MPVASGAVALALKATRTPGVLRFIFAHQGSGTAAPFRKHFQDALPDGARLWFTQWNTWVGEVLSPVGLKHVLRTLVQQIFSWCVQTASLA